MNSTPIFLMPVKLSADETELRMFKEAVESIKRQTDPDWKLLMIDDFSNQKAVYDLIDEMKNDLQDKLHVIYSDKNCGAGATRNKGVLYAKETGAPFIIFNDSDDLSDSRRLELVRKAFSEDETVNVVYTSFNIIDENGNDWPPDEINMSVKEITDGHTVDVVEGENAFVSIATKKKYTNLTSCTAVRTALAVAEPFPNTSVSEDSNTWFRYGAHPGKFKFIREIKGGYRICRGVQSRSRGANPDFYKQMFEVDSAGFEEAVKIAKKYGTLGGWDENDLRTAFHVRLALTLLHGGSEEYCKKSLAISLGLSKDKAIGYINQLFCEPAYKARLLSIASEEQ